eukprot:6566186-Pyramimonas_sp.AAC.1
MVRWEPKAFQSEQLARHTEEHKLPSPWWAQGPLGLTWHRLPRKCRSLRVRSPRNHRTGAATRLHPQGQADTGAVLHPTTGDPSIQ